MTRTRSFAVLATLLVLSAGSGWAGETASPHAVVDPHKKMKPIPPPAPAVPTPQSGPAAFDADKRLATMTTRLKLTPEQQTKLLPVLQDTQAQVTAVRAVGGKPWEVRDKVKSILQASNIKIEVLLDGEQKAEWDKMRQETIGQGRVVFKTTTLDPDN